VVILRRQKHEKLHVDQSCFTVIARSTPRGIAWSLHEVLMFLPTWNYMENLP